MDSRRVVRVPAAVWCLPAVAYAALIFALSSTTLPPEAGPIPGLFCIADDQREPPNQPVSMGSEDRVQVMAGEVGVGAASGQRAPSHQA